VVDASKNKRKRSTERQRKRAAFESLLGETRQANYPIKEQSLETGYHGEKLRGEKNVIIHKPPGGGGGTQKRGKRRSISDAKEMGSRMREIRKGNYNYVKLKGPLKRNAGEEKKTLELKKGTTKGGRGLRGEGVSGKRPRKKVTSGGL